jgi:ubiquinol-cytochrome c reductase cytochrome c subunit
MRWLVVIVALTFVGSAAAADGKQVFGRYCASCHGPLGEGASGQRYGGGAGRNQSVQTGRGPSLRGVGAMAADFYLRTGYMPLKRNGIQPRRSQQVLDDAQITALIHYVASLGNGPSVPQPHPERGNVSQGMTLFRSHCAGCHQIVAEGGYVTNAVPPALGDATPTQIAEAVRIGPYVMPSFSARAISNGELDSIVRYVEWTKNPDDRGGWALGHVGPVPEGLVTWFLGASVLIALCMLLGRRLRRG